MADTAYTTTTSECSSGIAYLQQRQLQIRGALDALEPIMAGICESPSPLYNSMQTLFDQLLDELSASQTVLMAMTPVTLGDLAAQADVIRYRYSDANDMHTVNGPLGQFLDRVESFAA